MGRHVGGADGAGTLTGCYARRVHAGSAAGLRPGLRACGFLTTGFHSQFTLFTTTPPLHSPSTSPATTSRFNSLRTQNLRHASRFLRRTTTSRLLMREPSMVVREAAAAQFEERQTEWVYSRSVVVMDVLWNLRFVVVAAVVLGLSWDEKPGVPGVHG
ncbi:hypothetical protein Droror1_Dr00025673 [Drosera rotundifolia]